MIYVNMDERHSITPELGIYRFSIVTDPKGKNVLELQDDWVVKRMGTGVMVPHDVEISGSYPIHYLNRRGYEAVGHVVRKRSMELHRMWEEERAKALAEGRSFPTNYYRYNNRPYATYDEFVEAALSHREKQIGQQINKHKKYLILMMGLEPGLKPERNWGMKTITKFKLWTLKKILGL